MKINIKIVTQLAFSIGIGGILLYYIFTQVDIKALLKGFEKANYFWVWVSILISIVAHVARGLRWNLLLQPLGYKIKPAHATYAVLAGYLANYIFPRAGEVVRCTYVKKTDNLPINIGFGTVITERLVDLVALVAVVALSFLFEYNRLSSFFIFLMNEKWKGIIEQWENSSVLIIAVSAVLIIGFFAAYRYRERLLKFSFVSKTVEFIKGLSNGILSITKLQNFGMFFVYTLVIWVAYYFMAYVIFFSLPETANLPPQAGLVVLALASLGMAAPVQGGIGVYHIMVAMALSIYGISQTDGYVMAAIFHTSQFVCILVLGSLSALLFLFIKPPTAHDGEENSAAD